jgi:hypothetical protein
METNQTNSLLKEVLANLRTVNKPQDCNIINFVNQIKETTGMPWISTTTKNTKFIVKRQLEIRFKNFWYAKVNTKFSTQKGVGGNKLRTYKMYKREFKFENYLTDIKNATTQKKLTQFRISTHTLKIETNRFDNKGKQLRRSVYAPTAH